MNVAAHQNSRIAEQHDSDASEGTVKLSVAKLAWLGSMLACTWKAPTVPTGAHRIAMPIRFG